MANDWSSMAIDWSSLQQSDFWRKKIRRTIEARDTNGDGYISRADFDLQCERCRRLNASNPEYVEKFAQYMGKFCETMGLMDESIKLTYSEMEDKFISVMKVMVENGTTGNMGTSMFRMVDIDEDGFISIEEWTKFYEVAGLDTAYARASFEAMDANHDQKVSKEEFMNYCMEYMYSTENKLNSAILYGPLD